MRIFNLTKQMGEFRLSIERMEFAPGQIHGLIGSNGSGKTTLAKLIMGILDADRGAIDYEGLSRRDITLTSQKPYLLHDTVYKNVIYPLTLRGIQPEEEKVDALLARCGLEGKKKQYARSLSSGEQQKLSFARALVFEPRLLIVDETLSNLDPDSAELFETIILEQQKADPITIIMISHQLVHLRRVCDRIHFMENGRLLTAGTVEEMLIHPVHPSVKCFLSKTEVSYRD